MGNIVHLAVDAERAGVGAGSNGIDDFLGFGDLPIGGAEAAVDDRDLVRMDRDAAGEAVAAGPAALGLQTFGDAEIGVTRVDLRNDRRRGGVGAGRAGEPRWSGPKNGNRTGRGKG